MIPKGAAFQEFTMKEMDTRQAVGFWIRLWAGLWDVIFVTLLVVAAGRVGILMNWYLPIELTVLLAYPAYTVLAHRWKAQTIGKWICGIAVTASNNQTAGLGRIVLRETVGKLASVLPLGGGFLWCAVFRRKRALHDYIAGTIVVRRPLPFGRWGCAVAALLVMGILIVALDVPGLVAIGGDFIAMRPAGAVDIPFERRDPALVVDAASLDESQLNTCSTWLRSNAATPIEYVVAKAQQHQVVIFGEVHEKKEALALLNELIPQLYHRAHVTKVAMEVFLSEDNDRLKRLVTAEDFSRGLAMQIARHQPWGIWGFKEYWDVMETVWRLNKSIPRDQEKVLIVGLDSPIDMASIGMTIGEGDNPSRHCPIWEKLRVVRLLRGLPKVLARDVRMAREIEREIITKDDRAIVWVGGQHAMPSPQPVNFSGLRATRMGALLRQKHGGKVFCIKLHGWAIPASHVDSKYRGPEPIIGSKIEEVMRRSGLAAVGFDTALSPFGRLRDAAAFDYHYEPRLGLEDIADGYLYIKPWREFTQCTWLSGYITRQMFAANKPFYQAFGWKEGKRFEDADAVNRFFENQ